MNMRPYLSLLLVSLLAVQAHTAKAVELTVDIDWQSMGVTPDLTRDWGTASPMPGMSTVTVMAT